MPPALGGEFGFAASGTCLEAAAGRWYIASGGVDPGRIFEVLMDITGRFRIVRSLEVRVVAFSRFGSVILEMELLLGAII
jgi:hypothetical protein